MQHSFLKSVSCLLSVSPSFPKPILAVPSFGDISVLESLSPPTDSQEVLQHGDAHIRAGSFLSESQDTHSLLPHKFEVESLWYDIITSCLHCPELIRSIKDLFLYEKLIKFIQLSKEHNEIKLHYFEYAGQKHGKQMRVTSLESINKKFAF